MITEIAEKTDLLVKNSWVNEKISHTLSGSNAKLSDIYDVVKFDPALSLLILKAANAKYGGLHNSISSIKVGMNIIGKEKVAFLNNTVKMYGEDHFLSTDAITGNDFWRHSLTTGLISEIIAKHIKRFSPINPDNLFCAGLIHDLGIVAMAKQSPNLIERLVEKAINENIPFYEAEEENNHAEIAAEILRLWGIPEKVYGPVWYHHKPSSTQKYKLSAAVIHVADVTASLIGMPLYEKDCMPKIDNEALDIIGLSPERLNVIARDAMDLVLGIEKEFK